jgi:hypothetical protein
MKTFILFHGFSKGKNGIYKLTTILHMERIPTLNYSVHLHNHDLGIKTVM